MKYAATATTLLLVAPAPAQVPPQPQPPQEDSRPVPQPPTAAQTADEIAQRMFLNGGSLMQAQLDAQAAGAAPPEGVGPSVSFFAVPQPEPTLIRRHDLLTVIIREESINQTSGETETEKSYEFAAALREYIDLDLSSFRLGSKRGDQGVDGGAEREFEGQGKTGRRDSFVARITAEVIDVKPNGTLVVRARKAIRTDDDSRTITLTGTCRTADVTVANTVLSTQLHDLRLEKTTSGPIRDATRRGLIPRIVDRVNPF